MASSYAHNAVNIGFPAALVQQNSGAHPGAEAVRAALLAQAEVKYSWAALPANFFSALLVRMGTVDKTSSRLVCKGWRLAVSAKLKKLSPSSVQILEIPQLFPGLTQLDCSKLEDLETYLETKKRKRGYVVPSCRLAPLTALSGLKHLEISYLREFKHGGLAFLTSFRELTGLKFAAKGNRLGESLTVLRSCPKLQDFEVVNLGCYDHEAVSTLASLTGLTRLSLDDRPIWGMSGDDVGGLGTCNRKRQSRAVAELFSKLTGLVSLQLYASDALDDEPMKKLPELRNLKQLDIGPLDKMHFGKARRKPKLQGLSGLTKLESLRVEGELPEYEPYWNTVAVITALTNLTCLTLCISNLSESDLPPIPEICKLGLRVFKLDGRHVFPTSTINELSRGLSLLETLDIKFPCKCWASSDSPTPVGPSLRSLQLMESSAIPTGIEVGLSQLTGLTRLDFRHSYVGYPDRESMDGITAVGALTQLVHLDLSSSKITDAHLGALAGLTGLEHLELRSLQAGIECSKALQHLTRLTLLNMMSTKADNTCLSFVSGLTNMEVLWLDEAIITDPGLAHLAGMTALRSLDLSNCYEITDDGVCLHLRPLAVKHSLKEVSLGRTGYSFSTREMMPKVTKSVCDILLPARATFHAV